MLLWIKNHQKPLFIFIPLITIFCLFLFYQSTQSSIPAVSPLTEQQPVTAEPEEIAADQSVDVLFVDIKGEVTHEGVYEMNNGDRVIDLIKKAGGELPDADMTAVNMAQKLHDEMVIIVPGKSAEGLSDLGTQSDKININRATQSELESIPGIGPSKAAAIIQYREEKGQFKSIEEIMNISGIGEKTFDKLKESISTY
ncbi:helix-hairpin-helix domain-containing protein [Jeotgalibacillus sp. JSM ZJ347]|uniref:helix-hairpin-helix domain-containing protein n=1 Tax=Jeotgalibacillus sp. JSM ZJ347 TaxID=3342117 RepID=UPI0035A88410